MQNCVFAALFVIDYKLNRDARASRPARVGGWRCRPYRGGREWSCSRSLLARRRRERRADFDLQAYPASGAVRRPSGDARCRGLPHVALQGMAIIRSWSSFSHIHAAGRDVPGEASESLRNELTEIAQRAARRYRQVQMKSRRRMASLFRRDKSVLADAISSGHRHLRRAFTGRFEDDAVFKQTPGLNICRIRQVRRAMTPQLVGAPPLCRATAQQDLTDDGG